MLRKISLWAVVVLVFALPLSAGGYYTMSQADVEEDFRPLKGNVSASSFYDYDEGARRSQNPLVERGESLLFVYEDPNGQLHLFIIHGPSDPRVDAEFRIVDVPGRAEWIVEDDPADVWPNNVYDLEGERAEWSWGGFWMRNRSAGGVLGPLGEQFDLRITPEVFPEAHRLYFLSGDVANPERIQLNRRDTIAITGFPWVQPTARLEIRPVEPRVRDEVTFDARGSELDPDLEWAEFRWDFGDGTARTTTEPEGRHTYTEAGTYEVTLTAVDSAGGESTTSFTVVVEDVAVSVERSISTTQALPGSTFRVKVRIRAERDLVGAGLQETVPTGWSITPVDSAGAVFRRPDVQWVFLEQIRAGTERVIVYDVTVPKAEELKFSRLPYKIEIHGHFQAKSPEFEIPIEGEYKVEITDCLSVLTAIAHLVVAPESEQPGGDKVDLRLSEEITKEQLQRAAELWRKDDPVPETCGERISLSKLKEIAAHHESCVPVDQALPELPRPNLRAERTIRTPIPCQGVVLGFYDDKDEPVGNRFTVKVEITSDVDVKGVGLDEELPSGWKVTPLDNAGFIYKPTANQWVYLGTLKAGQTKQVVYEVEVPFDHELDYSSKDPKQKDVQYLFGRVDSGWPCLEVDVHGDDRVELSECLDVIVAISRWDVRTEEIDLLLSDRITFQQVQRAVAFWLEGGEISRVCYPHVVEYETLKEIVARWLTDTPICDDLPAAPPEVCEDK